MIAGPQYDFVISLKRPHYKGVNLISQFLLVLFLASFIYFVIQSNFGNRQYWLALVPIMICGLWLWGYIKKADQHYVPYYRLELMIAAMGWFFIPLFGYSYMLGFAYAFMAVAERYIKFPDEVGFNKDKVVRNTFPPKSYEWFEIDNVVLRDNLFTLDLTNNKIIQKELEEPVSPELEQEFNSYCQNHLHFLKKQKD